MLWYVGKLRGWERRPKEQKPPGGRAEGAGERVISALALHKEQQSTIVHLPNDSTDRGPCL